MAFTLGFLISPCPGSILWDFRVASPQAANDNKECRITGALDQLDLSIRGSQADDAVGTMVWPS